jgi:hypothetical protein
MTRSHWYAAGLRPLVLLTSIYLAFGGNDASAQTVESTVHRQVLNAIAAYELPSEDVLKPILEEVGYQAKSPTLWRSLPSIRKLAEVYSAAESANAGGGNRAIASIADKMANRFDSLRQNTAIRNFINTQDLRAPIQFSAQVESTVRAVPVGSREVILALSDHIEKGRLGGPYGILTSTFSLDAERAYSILATSESTGDALMRGLGQVPEDQRAQKLRLLVTEAKKQYPAITRSAEVIAFEATLPQPQVRPRVKKLIDDLEKEQAGPRRPRSPDNIFVVPGGENDLVQCLCGGRPIGIRPRWQCVDGMPC